jgi:uncharacterized protein (TIGR03435 family)
MRHSAARLASFGMALIASAQAPSFDVASLKPVQVTGDLYRANLGTARHGEVMLTNATLSDCMRYAYGITNDAQLAGPDWIRSKEIRFDIVAKAPPDTPVSQLLLMLQTLLTDRFKMVTHREQRVLSFLFLTVAKSGPKLLEAKDAQNTATGPQIPGRIISTRMSMTTLTTLLSRFMRQTVLDQTGLTGSYDVNLLWTPEDNRPVADAAQRPPERTPEPTNVAPGPTIYTALQQQLGLKLESRKAPIEVIVIDHAEKVPVEN